MRRDASNDSYELERFRQDINLIEFAKSKGYAIDGKASSRSCCIMRDSSKDKIEVSRAKDGHWRYFSFRDERDNGDVIEFAQRRGGGRHRYSLGAVRKELRGWTNTLREQPPGFVRIVEPATSDRDAVAEFVASAKLLATHPYLESRGLTHDTLASARFRGTWRMDPDPRYGNVIFPHRDERGICGFEIKNVRFTGFAPGGTKGLWMSKAQPTDQRLVLAESAIDALSYHEVNPHPKTRYASFGGGLSRQQPELIERAISWMPAASVVVAATDNDKAGHAFATSIAELCAKHPHVTFERHAPGLGKDWNDHLRALRSPTRSLQLESQSRGVDIAR